MFKKLYASPSGIGVILAIMTLIAAMTVVGQANKSQSTIEITTIPPAGGGPGRQELIAGRINIADPGKYRLCIFSHTDRWYVQPYVAAPFTDPDPRNGRWQTRIHLGDEYAVLLVKPSYSPQATMLELPKIGGDVVAIAREAARQ
jgi:hypothetical protein